MDTLNDTQFARILHFQLAIGAMSGTLQVFPRTFSSEEDGASVVRESVYRFEAVMCRLKDIFWFIWDFHWKRILLYCTNRHTMLISWGSGECVPVCGSLVSIDGSFLLYRGFSREEDSILLYKSTSPARLPVHLSGVRESVYRFAKAWCRLTVLLIFIQGKRIHLFLQLVNPCSSPSL